MCQSNIRFLSAMKRETPVIGIMRLRGLSSLVRLIEMAGSDHPLQLLSSLDFPHFQSDKILLWISEEAGDRGSRGGGEHTLPRSDDVRAFAF
jgi:hypothetical protein